MTIRHNADPEELRDALGVALDSIEAAMDELKIFGALTDLCDALGAVRDVADNRLQAYESICDARDRAAMGAMTREYWRAVT